MLVIAILALVAMALEIERTKGLFLLRISFALTFAFRIRYLRLGFGLWPGRPGWC